MEMSLVFLIIWLLCPLKINLKGRTILQIVERGIDMRKYREASTDLLSPLNAGERVYIYYMSTIISNAFKHMMLCFLLGWP